MDKFDDFVQSQLNEESGTAHFRLDVERKFSEKPVDDDREDLAVEFLQLVVIGVVAADDFFDEEVIVLHSEGVEVFLRDLHGEVEEDAAGLLPEGGAVLVDGLDEVLNGDMLREVDSTVSLLVGVDFLLDRLLAVVDHCFLGVGWEASWGGVLELEVGGDDLVDLFCCY